MMRSAHSSSIVGSSLALKWRCVTRATNQLPPSPPHCHILAVRSSIEEPLPPLLRQLSTLQPTPSIIKDSGRKAEGKHQRLLLAGVIVKRCQINVTLAIQLGITQRGVWGVGGYTELIPVSSSYS
ncbi:hypothetical protein CRENBAI_011508 [Crenichthys baileyi]|uniref:Uncharacterized protein n=1 Tax=Crenichthys baileyi TaxID=28760 RepID=A0AAV9SKS3_9TELE